MFLFMLIALTHYVRMSKTLRELHPQFIRLQLSQAGNDDFVVGRLPCYNVGHVVGGQSAVLELLWADFYIDGNFVANNTYILCLSMGHEPTGINQVVMHNPVNICQWNAASGLVGAAGLNACYPTNRINLTTPDGHGVLIACPNIYFAADSTATGTTNDFACSVAFRYKLVSNSDFVKLRQTQLNY